jgi:Uma2 family endonuclease
MKAHKLPRLSVEEYIQQEIESNTKYEYHDGEIYALAGGTLNHGLICGNIYSELRNELKTNGSKCLPFTSEIKLYIEKTNSYVYPDSMVICGEIEQSEKNNNSVTNPVLIVEVLSKSTAEYDRGDKFYLYRQIPGFKEYVLIEQKKYVVDVHYKSDDSDLWRITRYEGLDKVVKLQSVDVIISMKDLYFRTQIDLPKQ